MDTQTNCVPGRLGVAGATKKRVTLLAAGEFGSVQCLSNLTEQRSSEKIKSP